MATDINELKIIIRGLLVSSPREINVAKLRYDFKTQEGCDIPFYDFGYHDITSFLRSIPDVCQISHCESGPYAIVRLVESDKSAHVSSLVMRQRTAVTRTRRRHSSHAVRGRYFHMTYKPSAMSHSFRSVKKASLKPIHYEHASREPSQKSYSFPSGKKSPVFCDTHSEFPEYDLLCSSHNGHVNVAETQPIEIKEENNETCDEICTYVPDTSGSEYMALPAFVDFHLRHLLTDNKGVHLDEVTEHLKDSLTMYGLDYSKNTDSVVQILRTIPNIRIENGYVHLHRSVHEEQPPEEVTHCVDTGDTSHKVDNVLEDDNTGNTDKGDLRATADIFVPSGKNEKSQRLERNLFSLMKDYPNGILGSELKEKYKMKFAAPLNFQILGYYTAWDLASSMPHIFNSIFLEDGNFKLFPAWLHSEQVLKDSKLTLLPEGKSTKKSFIPALTKRNVQWLMQGYPTGLQAKDFEKTYKDTFLGDIELTEMGFSCMEEFLHCLEELDIIQIHRTETDAWLLPSRDSGNFAVDETPLPLQENMENQIDIGALKEKFPSDVVGPDIHVEQVEIPSHLKKGSEQGVYVQEVNNPHHFWITLYGEQYTSALNSLMDDLQAFYCTKSHSYRMAPELIREGQDCVTQYVDEWHRARITQIISATEVQVCFYDYGTRRVVSKDNVHYLLMAHSALPAQAIRAALANIAPVGDKWTQEASKRFLQLIADRPLFGIVNSLDRINKVFSLFLCDTRGEEDIYIHDILVFEGFAVQINETSEKQLQNGDKIEVNGTESLQLGLETDESTLNTTDLTMTHTPEDDVVGQHITSSSEPLQEICSQNLRTSPLPCVLTDTKISCNSSIFTPTSVCNPASTFTSCVSMPSEVTVARSSVASLRPIAPPPGFVVSLKCETKANGDDEMVPPVFRSNSICDKNKESEEAVEIPKQCSDDSIMDMDEMHELHGRKSPSVSTYENFEHNRSAKGVSSGVNANFPQEVKSPCALGANSYPSWMPAPTYSQFSGFPPLTPLNINNSLTPFSLAPFPVQPVDFYSCWYYEQYRQQAILGMLAHQQMTASALHSLPPGLYVPHSQSTLNTHMFASQNNQMNISEVSSPVLSPSMKSNSRPGSANSATTQTQVVSSCENSYQVQKPPTNKTKNASSSVKLSVLTTATDAGVQTCADDTPSVDCPKYDDIHKNSVAILMSEDKSDSLVLETTSDEASSEGVVSNDTESGTCKLTVNASQKMNDISGSNLQTNLHNASTKWTLNNFSAEGTEPCVLQSSPAALCMTDTHWSQNKMKDEENNKCIENRVSGSSATLVSQNTSLVNDLLDLEIESRDKENVGEDFVLEENINVINGKQVTCDKKSVENVMILNSDISVPDQNNYEDKAIKIVNKSVNDSEQCSMIKSKELNIENQDLDQINLPLLNEEKKSRKVEDGSCGQTVEFIEKVHEESLVATTHCEIFATSSEDLPGFSVHTQNGSMEGSGNITNDSASESTKSFQISNSKILSCRSSDIWEGCEVGNNDINFKSDETETVSCHSGKNEKLVTELQFSVVNSDVSPVARNYSDLQERCQDLCSVSEVLCSDFKTLTVTNLGSSDRTLHNSEQRTTEVLPLTLKRCSQIATNIIESSEGIFTNNEQKNTYDSSNRHKDLLSTHEHVETNIVLDKLTVSQSYSVEEREEESEVSLNAYDFQSSKRSKKQGSATDDTPTTSSIPTTPKKGRPLLGGPLVSGIPSTIASVSTTSTTIHKSYATVSNENALRTKNDTFSSESTSANWKTTWCSEENGRPGVQKESGRDFTKNLSLGPVVRNLPKQTNSFWHKESHQNTKQDASQQFVKKIYLRSKKVHQINLDGRPYVLTDEIVSYFTPFNGRHVILKILEARKVEINFLELSRRRRPEFFECLDKSNIECINRGPTGNVIGSVHIVPLRSVPYMLRALNRDDAALSLEVKEEMEKFDSNDPYWSGHCN